MSAGGLKLSTCVPGALDCAASPGVGGWGGVSLPESVVTLIASLFPPLASTRRLVRAAGPSKQHSPRLACVLPRSLANEAGSSSSHRARLQAARTSGRPSQTVRPSTSPDAHVVGVRIPKGNVEAASRRFDSTVLS